MKKILICLFTSLIFIATCDSVSACNPSTSDEGENSNPSSVKKRKTAEGEENPTTSPETSNTEAIQKTRQLLINAMNDKESHDSAVEYVKFNGTNYLCEVAKESPDAMFFYGYCLRNGIGCHPSPKNINIALEIFRERAQAGHTGAIFLYGHELLTGSGFDRQTVEIGFMWMRTAAKRNAIEAFPILVNCLRQGIGCAKTEDNLNEAEELNNALENPGNLDAVVKKFKLQRMQAVKTITGKAIKEAEVKFTASLLHTIIHGVYSPDILKVMDLFPLDSIPSASAYLSWWANSFETVDYRLIRETLERVPSQERSVKLERCHKLITDPQHVPAKSELRMLIPEEDWIYLPGRFLALLSGFQKDDRWSLIEVIAQIKENERFDSITTAMSLLEKLDAAPGVIRLFKAITSLSYEERISLTTIETCFLSFISEGERRAAVLKWLVKQPVHSRNDRIRNYREKLILCKSVKEIQSVLEELEMNEKTLNGVNE